MIMGSAETISRAITPVSHPLSAYVKVPGSKSHTNRALLLSALAYGTTTLHNALFSEDTHYFSTALTELGFEHTIRPEEKIMIVRGLGGNIPVAYADLFIGNAGTAIRFLTAMLTLGHGEYTLDGVPRMRQRPIGDLVIALNNLGAQISAASISEQSLNSGQVNLYPPVTIFADGLKGGTTRIRGDVSSQYISALLMTAPYAAGEVEISVEGSINSKPYIDLTLGVMVDFGVNVHREGYSYFHVIPHIYSSPGKYTIESDASAASYFFAAPAVCGGWVEVGNISHATRQGDIAFLDVLSKMGCSITATEDAVRVISPNRLNGVDINMTDISDTSMTLAVIAPFAGTPTTIRGIASSRAKETDRVTATCTELRRLGVRVDEYHDGMTIYPCEEVRASRIHTYDDHRMAMSLSLVGLRSKGVCITNPACVRKTFPNYWSALEELVQTGS